MVYIMLAEGFEEIEALSVVDILRRGEVDAKTVSVYNTPMVCGAHGIEVKADIMFDDIENDIDAIVLPGGIPGTPNLQSNKNLEKLILDCAAKGIFVAAICAAPMILGELNLLENRVATCYPSFEKHLKGAILSEDRVCVDGKFITSRGAGTAHDFAFTLLKLLKNPEIKNKIREGMLYDI